MCTYMSTHVIIVQVLCSECVQKTLTHLKCQINFVEEIPVHQER